VVALLAASVLLSSGDGSNLVEAYPDEIIDLIARSGIDVEGTRSSWAGQISHDGITVNYSIEAQGGRAIAIDLTSRYSFPIRVSARGLQDWAIRTRTGVVAQSYLDGSVYLGERIPIAEPVSDDEVPRTVENGLIAFGLFGKSFVRPLGGQQVFDQPTISPPKPADRMIVDYLSSQDLSYLTKIWGWSYEGPFGAPVSPNWVVPVKIDGRLWTISGPGGSGPSPSSMNGFSISGQFQARSTSSQKRFSKWTRRYKWDQVVFAPNSADVQVSTRVELKEGMSLAAIRKHITDFVHRAEKLPAADNSVFG
jgi:hypothetical protein